MIRRSLEKLGAGRSIVLDKNGKIIAGNKTAESAADVGIEELVVVRTKGNQLVAVMREDLDLDDPTGQARELAYADNRAGEVSLDWDSGVLSADIAAGVDLSDWFQGYEWEELGITEPAAPADAEPQLDRAEELREKWGVETGQLWRLPSRTPGQEHRLICGDCTDAAVVERVLDGDVPLLMVTDPPYGVEYDPAWRKQHVDEGGRWNSRNTTIAIGKVEHDDRVDWGEAWALFPGDVAYVWHGGLHGAAEFEALMAAGFCIRTEIVWAKQAFVFGRGDYHWQHEACWHAVRKGKTGHWAGDRKQSTVWEIRNNAAIGDVTQNEEVTGHGTQKPLECMARPIRNHDSPLVYDPFGGSGTTMVACENLGRACRMVEISPGYVAVALERYATAFGIEPELVT